MKKSQTFDLRSKASESDIAIIELAVLKRLATIAKNHLESIAFYDVQAALMHEIDHARSVEQLLEACEGFITDRKAIALILSEDLQPSGSEVITYETEKV